MNPVIQLVQMLRGSGNPMQMLAQASRQNPQLNQVMQMVNGKTPGEMQAMVNNMARQRGVDIHQLALQMGIQLPK